MGMYAIKDTTLTALGDAIRDKVIGTSEYHYVSDEVIIPSSGATPIFEYNFKCSKIKLIVDISSDYTYSNHNQVIKYDTSSGTVAIPRQGEIGYVSNHYEAIIDGSYIRVYGYVITGCPKTVFTYQLIQLDENGEPYTYTPLEMVDVIQGLNILPNEALTITGDCAYRFAYDGSNWLIEKFGDKITTNNITNAEYMFYGNKYKGEIPFELNLATNAYIRNMFYNANISKAPVVNTTINKHLEFKGIFTSCSYLTEIPEWLIELLEYDFNLGTNNTVWAPWDGLFENCYSLREIPERVINTVYNPTATANYYTMAYSQPYSGCRALNKLVNLPCEKVSMTSNCFSGFFNQLSNATEITFALDENGNPQVAPWKSQTLDFTQYVGYQNSRYNLPTYFPNIDDYEVTDDATYQALKNEPDWWSANINYSRYNHDSAVNTINSLPDCSATGTNTIKFKGASGALTDGGAINTLTEEEIAVATAKGWTVSLV